MNKKILHFDTIDGVSVYDNNFQTTFNTTLKVSNPPHKVKRLSLKSVEMPINMTPVRSANSSNVLYLQFSYSTYTNIQIPIYISGNTFMSASSLISTINSQLALYLASYTGLIMYAAMTYSVEGNYTSVQFVSNQSTVFYFYQDSLLLSSILGIVQTSRSFVSVSKSIVQGVNPVNLNLDNYLCMYISNLPVSSSNASGRNCTFKIPIPVLNSQILFYSDNNQFTQTVDINDTNFTLDRLTVVIYDRYGNAVNNFNGNYSFSLLVEYDSLW